MSWQSAIPPQPQLPTFNTHGNITGSRRLRSLSPPFGTPDIEGPLEPPELKGWLEKVDRDHLRGRWGDNFSQLSAHFELEGFTSLLSLEGMSVDYLVYKAGIGEDAAQRLLRYAREDIGEFRANNPLRAKKGKYSY